MAKLYINRRYSFFDDRSRHYLSINGKKQDKILIPGNRNEFDLEKGDYTLQIKTLVPLKSNSINISLKDDEEIHLTYRLKTSVIIVLILIFALVIAMPFIIKSINTLYLVPVICIGLLILFTLSFTVFSTIYELKVNE